MTAQQFSVAAYNPMHQFLHIQGTFAMTAMQVGMTDESRLVLFCDIAV